MLKRIYINNYKTCVNFDLEFDEINLLMGTNGAGKSTIFEVLHKLQLFTQDQDQLDHIFPYTALTRWQDSKVQEFELEIDILSLTYTYQLAIEFDSETQKATIRYERLLQGESLLAKYEKESGYYLNVGIDNGFTPSLNITNILFNSTILRQIPDNKYTKEIIQFRERLDRFIIVHIVPSTLDMGSEKEERFLDSNAKNFASWYRYISKEREKTDEISAELSEVLDGFNRFQLRERDSQFMELWTEFEQDAKKSEYRFDELSDGQRKLIVLYTILNYAKHRDYTIYIDEPANYVALSEIQPWLLEAEDMCDDGNIQALLISHHPELINYLVPSRASIWFAREDSSSPTYTKRILEHDPEGISVSELIARGWIDE